jgi:hypothetical protein
MRLYLTELLSLIYTPLDMDVDFPASPADLIHRTAEHRAREVFDDYAVFTAPMQEQARMLMKVGFEGELTDRTFRDLIALTLHLWRECNQARFMESKDYKAEFSTTVRSVQIDQFINGSMLSLNGIPELLEDNYTLAEPDGS